MREQWGYLSLLRRLLEEEVMQRREKSKITRIHRADFPQMKYLEELQREELLSFLYIRAALADTYQGNEDGEDTEESGD